MDKVNLYNKKLALFFSYKLSLKTLRCLGILSRESKVWEIFGRSFDQIYFLTYDTDEDAILMRHFPKVKLLNNRWRLHPILYSVLAPLLYRKELAAIDIYRVNQLSGALPAIISKILYRKRLIIRCGFQLSLFFKKQRENKIRITLALALEKIAYSLANKVLIATIQDMEYVIMQHKIDPNKISVIPNGIDIELFNIQKNVRKEPGRILFVGRLIEQKNLFALLKAVKGIEGVHLVIIGKGYLRGVLMRRAAQEGINAFFIDSVDNNALPIEYNKSEVFVLPSLFEGNPKVLLEAMACGAVVIGSNREGINSIIKNRVNGILCEPSAEEIRGSILEILSNRILSANLVTNARKEIENNFNLYKLIAREANAMLQYEDYSYCPSI